MKSLPAQVTSAAQAAQPALVSAGAAAAGSAGLAGGPPLQWSPSFNDLRQVYTPARSPAGDTTAAGVDGPLGKALVLQAGPQATGLPGALDGGTALPEAALLSGLVLFLFGLVLRRFARPQRRRLLIGARLPTPGAAAPPARPAAATGKAHHSDAMQPQGDVPRSVRAI